MVADTLRLLGSALGTLGGLLVFAEFFQLPSYLQFNAEFGEYRVDTTPGSVREHTWLGRAGGLCVAVGFALLFVATFLG
jgi:hypothetical protein